MSDKLFTALVYIEGKAFPWKYRNVQEGRVKQLLGHLINTRGQKVTAINLYAKDRSFYKQLRPGDFGMIV